MSKRLQHPKGPANVKASYLKPILNEDGKAGLKQHKGFLGFPGFKYHPTRGFKKISGFEPVEFQDVPVDAFVVESKEVPLFSGGLSNVGTVAFTAKAEELLSEPVVEGELIDSNVVTAHLPLVVDNIPSYDPYNNLITDL